MYLIFSKAVFFIIKIYLCMQNCLFVSNTCFYDIHIVVGLMVTSFLRHSCWVCRVIFLSTQYHFLLSCITSCIRNVVFEHSLKLLIVMNSLHNTWFYMSHSTSLTWQPWSPHKVWWNCNISIVVPFLYLEMIWYIHCIQNQTNGTKLFALVIGI